jgi:hypothetical protein
MVVLQTTNITNYPIANYYIFRGKNSIILVPGLQNKMLVNPAP